MKRKAEVFFILSVMAGEEISPAHSSRINLQIINRKYHFGNTALR